MIIVGDVALAHSDTFTFSGFTDELLDLPWCLNLEGPILPSERSVPSWGVYNSDKWISSFDRFRLGPVFLANNHIQDVDDGVQATITSLRSHGLLGFGAGKNESDAAMPATCSSAHGDEYVVLGFGWPVIGCVPAQGSEPGVSRLEGGRVLHLAKKAFDENDTAKLVVIIHGNYEFELYPQPAHRALALQLIDLGAYAVVFHHPHIVGPVETYKGRTIAYSLGNWAFSYGKHFEGRLCFPESSFHQIALELNSSGDVIHHVQFAPPSSVNYVRAELVSSRTLSLQAEFQGFSNDAYIKWFKKNRKKRKGLPVYRSADHMFSNSCRDFWVAFRQKIIDRAAMMGLKPMRGKTKV